MAANFDRIARPYRWMEYLSFGRALERCRFFRLDEMRTARRALVLGDGDGRFLARLLQMNSEIEADVIDLSPAMLALLQARVEWVGAGQRVALACMDARKFVPANTYDLVATHFFLDCLTTEEIAALACRIRPHMAADARWVVSEFAIPPGPAAIYAWPIVAGLYVAFGLLTGLRVRQLPDHARALKSAGMVRRSTTRWLGGLLVSERWEIDDAK
jgi:ubiquinone/menaquinone biosynthesis C-methylase UbiE